MRKKRAKITDTYRPVFEKSVDPTVREVSMKDLYEMYYHIEDMGIRIYGIKNKLEEIINSKV